MQAKFCKICYSIFMKEVLNIYKPLGATPLRAIELFKDKNPEYVEAKMTYAGRLDPMAEGVLLVLVRLGEASARPACRQGRQAGDAIHRKDEYLKLDKEYEAEILFGFETDTYDLLGLPCSSQKSKQGFGASLKPCFDFCDTNLEARLPSELRKFVGDFTFSLPAYSSYKINGKPLFQWAREACPTNSSKVGRGRLSEIEIPKRTVKIHGIDFLGSREIKGGELLKQILKKINLVKGDFRQEEIKEKWSELLTKEHPYKLENVRMFKIAKIRISCSSGTYVRSIVHELGKRLEMGVCSAPTGAGAVLFSLKRTKVDRFDIKDSVILH
jgi:tRNA pseudouridine55 synthase